jgi:phosphotriesterase-related protein
LEQSSIDMKVRTILGDIPAAELGATACHEHLLWQVPEPYTDEDPDLGFDSISAAVSEMQAFKSAGGSALVEMTTTEIGRRPLEMSQISRLSGIHVIAASGHHKDKFSSAVLRAKSVDEIADSMITDITIGMNQTKLKAGIIKAATSLNAATESEKRVILAAGIVHRTTGAPVGTHTEAGTFAIEQAELLIQAGVAPDKLLIGHLDRGLQAQIYLDLAKKGVYLGFDQIGKEKYWPDADRVSLIRLLVEAGYSRQIVLSTDSARKSAWLAYNPRAVGIVHLFMNFLPALRKAGVSEEHIQRMVVENPARLLSF